MNQVPTQNRLAPIFRLLQDQGNAPQPYPWMDLGTIEERASTVDGKDEVIMDDRTGISQPITTIQNAFDLSFELTTPNTSLRVQQMYYRASQISLPVTNQSAGATNIAGGTFTTVPHTFYPGAPVKILDSSQNPKYGITAISAVTVAGSTNLVYGVDYTYTPQDLLAGFIYILPTSTLVTGTAGVTGAISYTTGAINGPVFFVPGAGPCTVNGLGQMDFVSCGGRMGALVSRFSVTIPSLDLNMEKTARVKATVRKLYDPTGSSPNYFLAYAGYPTP